MQSANPTVDPVAATTEIAYPLLIEGSDDRSGEMNATRLLGQGVARTDSAVAKAPQVGGAGLDELLFQRAGEAESLNLAAAFLAKHGAGR